MCDPHRAMAKRMNIDKMMYHNLISYKIDIAFWNDERDLHIVLITIVARPR